ncbi:MAG: hypothetical protein FWH02_00215 [Oscillospiraceae bacterium]|nr:hypothetical protein [Oscillospiraceae bacterium]
MDKIWQVGLTEMTVSGLFMALCSGTQKSKLHWICDKQGRFHLEWEEMLVTVIEKDGRFLELRVQYGRLESVFKATDISPVNKALHDYTASLVRMIQRETYSNNHGLERKVKEFIGRTIE